MPSTSISQRIADELSVRESQVASAVKLLDEGSTVPFIARYRKEATGGLDDTQLRTLEERLSYLRELEDRRAAILSSVREQDKLTPELELQIRQADTKTRLEDLYLPYKPKRRTKAQIAREAGLEPLADRLLADPSLQPDAEAAGFVSADKGVADVKAALDGARHILVERFGEDAELVGRLRATMADKGVVTAKVIEEKRAEGAKFSDYFEFDEPWAKVPSHRALALFRGRTQGVLDIRLDLPVEEGQPHPAERTIAAHTGIRDQGRPADKWLSDVVRWTWKLKIGPHVETDLMGDLRERAEDEAIRVFARNLHDLLLAAPAGPRTTIGLDPGIRTGVKVAVVDATGKLVDTATVYPHQPRNDWDGAIAAIAALAVRHKAELISIGNGTASRETDKLVADLFKRHPELKLTKLVVSEAGASVYSASETAAAEFPKLDVSLRGAVSIARRLQDPLAELVKIEPKSIGVGQYQHDVSGGKLARSLDAVVEDCVNAVGVDLNTASVPLLTRVSGLNETIARNIVEHRDRNGAFRSRKQLLDVARLGPKTFEQAAGFLRIREGDNPLDTSAVHPEAYPLVERILKKTGKDLGSVIGDARFLRGLNAEDFTDERFGVPTIEDILKELEKPGRDPRPEFKTATFQEGVEELKDLQTGMVLEGVVTNVTAFGAFVDIGVHQDGLVHISQLSTSFVKDPHTVVKAGDIVKVKVMEVDIPRKRIGLTMRLTDAAPRPERGQGRTEGQRGDDKRRDDRRSPPPGKGGSAPKPAPKPAKAPEPVNNAFAEAFARAQAGKKR
ncbi:RNA-binding transcriptional accessory protein [Azospirillum brasilense]|uniref:Small ribosomal subunit protein bS1 n=1 Tax=Azospirillum brasilense TaxID=192 RepID=A0A0P0F231_AZOBR|nr:MULTISPECIES: Tex family protein [Azospirillum]ALJ37273.1 RNA-binding transcriptional accessory protein [Azospirillum brasilense]MDW7551997.1 Tex family protein [Azospirillum brasilense]MDW7591432.1 Tex family protein [Azospirillum brasilense]MDW7626602.1 Tex family protein [Azospirillum brasilense]MDX5951049.1 Tex family protein [Azospirillum brasilense]